MEQKDKKKLSIKESKKEEILIDVGEILKSVTGKIKPELVDKMLEQIRDSLSFRLSDSVETAVNEFLVKEIQPAIKKKLLANKQAILNGIESSMKNFGNELGKKIKEKTVEKFAKIDSYDLRKIFEAIF